VVTSAPSGLSVGDTIITNDWILLEELNGIEIVAENGSYVEVVEITAADNKVTQWGRSNIVSDGYIPLIIPDAPTGLIQDDSNNTFGWTFVTGYSSISDYEISLDGGSSWRTATTNPLKLENKNYVAGKVQVRVKADAGSGRLAGNILSSTAAYTKENSNHSSDPGSGSSGSTPSDSNNNKTIRQAQVTANGNTSSSTMAKVDVNRTTENNKVIDSVVLDETKTEEVLKQVVEEKKETVTLFIDDLPEDSADEVSVKVTNSSMDKITNVQSSLQIQTKEVMIELPKETVKLLSQSEQDLYFRVVPVVDETKKQEVIDNTLQASIVQKVAGTNDVKVLGIPMTIETNYKNLNTKVTFSLKDMDIPTDPVLRDDFIKNLAVFIQHSDGEKVLDRGTVIYDMNGNPVGIEIKITKFSTFTILSVDNAAPTAVNAKLSGTAKIGSKLTAKYTYNDFDKDKQGKTIYKWYRADNAKGKNKKLISGAVRQNYKITKKDEGKYIITEITPTAKSGVKMGTKVYVSTKTTVKKQYEGKEKTVSKKTENKILLKLGLISSKTYADKLIILLKDTYNAKNVTVEKENGYYRITAEFADKASAEKVAKVMKEKDLIINYSIINTNKIK
jgi:hypothetical protein